LSEIKDELTSFIFFNTLRIFLFEYIPVSSNGIIAINDELDTRRKVEEGLMTSMIDQNPNRAVFPLEDNELTKVTIVNADPNDYVIFNAQIAFEEVVEQEEEICVYIDAYGRIIYSTDMITIDNKNGNFSLDKVTRILTDLVQDSSRMIKSMLSTYQRRLLNLVFSDAPEHRNKFTILVTNKITPQKNAVEFQDGEDLENELNQIISTTTLFHDMKNSDDQVFHGTDGMIIATDSPDKYEDIISIMGFYLSLDSFQKNYFAKMFVLWDELNEARKLINESETDPRAINSVKLIISKVSASVVLMNELLSFMQKSIENMNQEYLEMDKNDSDISELIEMIEFDDVVAKALIRIEDARLIVSGLREEVNGVHGLINSMAEKQMSKMNETLKDSIASMDEMNRVSDRTGIALDILEVILAGSIAFQILYFLSGEYIVQGIVSWIEQNIIFWMIIGITLFAVIGLGLYKVIRYIKGRSEPNMRLQIKITKKFDMPILKKYLDQQQVISRESTVDLDSEFIEFTWYEEGKKWLNNKIKIKMKLDVNNNYINSILLNIGSPNKISVQQVKTIMMKTLEDEGIVKNPF